MNQTHHTPSCHDCGAPSPFLLAIVPTHEFFARIERERIAAGELQPRYVCQPCAKVRASERADVHNDEAKAAPDRRLTFGLQMPTGSVFSREPAAPSGNRPPLKPRRRSGVFPG